MASPMDEQSKSAPQQDSHDSEKEKKNKTSPGEEYFLPLSHKTKALPDWLDHFNLRDLKILFKCSVAVWILTLLIVIDPTLKAIGQATFFGVIVIFIAPPSGVALIGIMIGVMIVVGVCLGWVWGVITMKAALATRPAADLQQQYAALQASAPQNTTNVVQATGQATYQQIAIYEGYLLDTRVTLTYFCMLGLFIYLMARLRVAAPKLTLVQMFAIIITDIFLTIGPLLPQFQGTIPQTLIIPAAIAVGINLACNLLFFPESTSHIVLLDMEKMLTPMNGFLSASSLFLANPTVKLDMHRLKKTKTDIVQLYRALDGNLKFMALDVSVGKWSAGDVTSLKDPLQHVMVSFISMLQIEITRLEFQLKDQKLLEMAEKTHGENEKESVSGGHQFARAFDLRQQFRDSNADRVRETMLKEYGVISSDILSSSAEGLLAIREAVHECNSKRWFKRPSEDTNEALRKRHAETLELLQQHIDKFPPKVADHLWTQYSFAREQKEASKDSPQQRQAVYILVMEERLINFAQAVHKLLARVVALEGERRKAQFWWPMSIKDIVPLALDTDSPNAGLEPQITRIKTNAEKHNKSKKKDKSKDESTSSIKHVRSSITKTRGAHQRSLAERIVVGTAHWFGNTEGLFALRVLIVSLGLAAIGANRNTAGFFYREKGLWALIMAQTALTPYTADFIFGMLVRLAGTIIGALLGLAAWYIGAGSGPGNPYGIAAIMIPIIVVAMWLRLFGSPAMLQGIIIATATAYLVMAYSWVDTHIPSYGNPGVGVAVFWRRMLLVMIGFGAATFVTLFPRPPSANRHYRRILSASLQTNKDQYALFVATRSTIHKSDDVRKITEKTAIDVAETLLEIEPLITLTGFEISTSNIDSKTLGLACHLCMNVNQYITQLTIYTTDLPQSMKDRFFQSTGAASEETIGEIMATLTVIQHALGSGSSLPAILSAPLMERKIASMKTRMEALHIDAMNLTADLLKDRAVRRYLSAIAAFIQLLGSIDELVLVVKQAVGETSFIDLEA